jgi:hypothetical protein
MRATLSRYPRRVAEREGLRDGRNWAKGAAHWLKAQRCQALICRNRCQYVEIMTIQNRSANSIPIENSSDG